MKTKFTNRYIFVYATVLVIVVAAVLSITAVVLKPRQTENAKTEKIQNLLAAINVQASFQDADALYKKYFVEELGINKEGEIVSTYHVSDEKLDGNERPFGINLKKQQTFLKEGKAAVFPLYIFEKDGEKGYVVPMYGNGLWGPIWGNIAFGPDFNTVMGVSFGHKGETPGLGAEIATPMFQQRFIGKKIFNKEGQFTSIAIKKAANSASESEVDAISGGTITSNGVSDMLKNDLDFYQNYRNKVIQEERK